MKLFIAIIFFCQNEQCAFWKGDKVTYSEKECRTYLAQSIEQFPNFPVLVGTCVSVPTNNLVSQ
jgi:hypothetical protein